jgi:hypothetical protein
MFGSGIAVGYAGRLMFCGPTSTFSISRTQGRKRGSSLPLSSYREPRMMTFPFALMSKCVSRKPQTSRLSASFGSGAGGFSGMINEPARAAGRRAVVCDFSGTGWTSGVFGVFVTLKSRFYVRLLTNGKGKSGFWGSGQS